MTRSSFNRAEWIESRRPGSCWACAAVYSSMKERTERAKRSRAAGFLMADRDCVGVMSAWPQSREATTVNRRFSCRKGVSNQRYSSAARSTVAVKTITAPTWSRHGPMPTA
jgi:hypothetical protein